MAQLKLEVVSFYITKIPVKFTLEQTVKAQRGSRNKTLLLL
jgi:hypothetical protein